MKRTDDPTYPAQVHTALLDLLENVIAAQFEAEAAGKKTAPAVDIQREGEKMDG
nr:hypothetical protein [uncultured Agathobaculum sp.]